MSTPGLVAVLRSVQVNDLLGCCLMNNEPVKYFRVTLSVNTDSQEGLTRTVEVLARSLTGLALEGIEAVLLVNRDDEEYEEEEESGDD